MGTQAPKPVPIPQRPWVRERTFKPPHDNTVISFNLRSGHYGHYIIAEDALNRNYYGLLDHEHQINFGPETKRVTLRFEWPGYVSWAHSFKATSNENPGRPLSKAKISSEIALALRLFIQQASNQNPTGPENATWMVGVNGLKLENIAIISLHPVSAESYMVEFGRVL